MAIKIFVTATGQHFGKTTICISLLHLARKKYQRIGFIKPIGPKPVIFNGQAIDKDVALMTDVFDLTSDLEDMSPVLIYPDTTKKVVDGELQPEQLQDTILKACAELEKKCDFIVIEGTGHPGVGSIMKLSNARIAKLLDASVLMITGGGIGNMVDSIYLDLALFEKEGVAVKVVLANKLLPEKKKRTIDYVQRALANESFTVIGGFEYQPILANPTLRHVSERLNLLLHGNQQDLGKVIHNVVIGASSTQKVAERLKSSTLLIVTSSRDELLVTLSQLYLMADYRDKIVGLIIPGVVPISKITQNIIDLSNIPYMRTDTKTTTDLYKLIVEDVSKTIAIDEEKLNLIKYLAENELDFSVFDTM